ncbi:MAG: nucleoside deaminase, partial [Nitrospirota bacterium]|nr:nucleoside deaminase [Nitrospirota bacterium]
MPSYPPVLTVEMPQWLQEFLSGREAVYPSMEARMRLVLELARLNVENKTGGPFAAAIFTVEDHRLVAPGVNLVQSANCSILHAEITAIALAQKIAGSYDLGGQGLPALELVCSSEPCAMCLGAACWSGVRRLVCGARDEDVRSIGFDE